MPPQSLTRPYTNASTDSRSAYGVKAGPSSCATGSYGIKALRNRCYYSRSRPPRSSPPPEATSGAQLATSSNLLCFKTFRKAHDAHWAERRRSVLESFCSHTIGKERQREVSAHVRRHRQRQHS